MLKQPLHRLLPLLLMLILPLALLADATPVVTHDPSGNEITTTTTTTATTNPDGTYTESTVTKVVVKNPAGNVIKKSSKSHDVKYKTKGGKQLKVTDDTNVDTYNLDGSSTTTLTSTTVDSEHNTVDETVTKFDHAADGTMTGERTTTHRAPGEKSEKKERLTQNGKWEEISMASPPTSDAMLTSDPRFAHVKPIGRQWQWHRPRRLHRSHRTSGRTDRHRAKRPSWSDSILRRDGHQQRRSAGLPKQDGRQGTFPLAHSSDRRPRDDPRVHGIRQAGQAGQRRDLPDHRQADAPGGH